MAKRNIQPDQQQPAQAAQQPTQSTFHYEPIPTSRRLMEVIEKMPPVPSDWRRLSEYLQTLGQWQHELRDAAHNCCSAANDATGLTCEVIDGTRKIDDPAAQVVAYVTAIRA